MAEGAADEVVEDVEVATEVLVEVGVSVVLVVVGVELVELVVVGSSDEVVSGGGDVVVFFLLEVVVGGSQVVVGSGVGSGFQVVVGLFSLVVVGLGGLSSLLSPAKVQLIGKTPASRLENALNKPSDMSSEP